VWKGPGRSKWKRPIPAAEKLEVSSFSTEVEVILPVSEDSFSESESEEVFTFSKDSFSNSCNSSNNSLSSFSESVSVEVVFPDSEECFSGSESVERDFPISEDCFSSFSGRDKYTSIFTFFWLPV